MARRGPHSRRRAPHPIKSNADTPLNYADVAGGSDAAVAAGSLPARGNNDLGPRGNMTVAAAPRGWARVRTLSIPKAMAAKSIQTAASRYVATGLQVVASAGGRRQFLRRQTSPPRQRNQLSGVSALLLIGRGALLRECGPRLATLLAAFSRALCCCFSCRPVSFSSGLRPQLRVSAARGKRAPPRTP